LNFVATKQTGIMLCVKQARKAQKPNGEGGATRLCRFSRVMTERYEQVLAVMGWMFTGDGCQQIIVLIRL